MASRCRTRNRPERSPGRAAARLVVFSASPTSGAPSQAEFVEPFRSLLATITGADSGVVTVASSAFKPSTRCGPTRRPACYSRRSVPSGTRMTTPWRKPWAGSTTELINPNKPWRTAEDLEVATLHYLD